MKDIKKKDNGLVISTGGLDISKMRKKKNLLRPTGEAIQSVKTQFGKFLSLQVLMMFDITGSMFGYFDLVRAKLQKIVAEVKKESENTEFSIFAYRNHGDEHRFEEIYYTSPLTENLEEIHATISTIQKGGGGPDALTCMEDCFCEANKLSWNPSSPKAVVVIGDMPPHGVVDSKHKCPNKIDYEVEVSSLKSKGIKIYPVFCPNYQGVKMERIKGFFQWLATETGAKYLEISEIDLLVELLIGICMKETGKLDKYISGLKQKGQLTSQTEKALLMLKEGR